MTDLDKDIIPTAIIIKNIPLNWNAGHVLHLMHRKKLPSPRALNFLYDDFRKFRGMAFAEFASSENARHVIQKLNRQWLSGGERSLNVQYKRKRPEIIAGENLSSSTPSHSKHHCQSDIRDFPYVHPQEKVSSVPRPTREKTPASESYELLMSYQTHPVEKEKLRKFLARTKDYQEAVNEFAKNRVREAKEGGTGTSTEIPPILEMGPAIPGEWQQVAGMESQFGLGGEKSSCGSLVSRQHGEQDVANLAKDGNLEKQRGYAEEGAELDQGMDEEGIEKGRAEVIMRGGKA
ncbi:MAG: hypothetical protein Q9161_003181 [Pseudevernia consocians]